MFNLKIYAFIMWFFNILKNRIILIFIIVLTIIGIIGGIFYIDNRNSNALVQDTGLKNYAQFKEKIIPLLPLDNQDKLSKAISALENKNNPNKVRFNALRVIEEVISSQYGKTNNHKYFTLLYDLDKFAKENFPKDYEAGIGFKSVCQDPKCADSPQPPEILQIIEEVKKSDLPLYVIDNVAGELKNTTYIEKKYKQITFDSYYFDLAEIKNYLDASPSASKTKIYIDFKKFLQQNFPSEFKDMEKSTKSN